MCGSELTSTPPTPLQTQEGGKEKKTLIRASVDGRMQGDRQQTQTEKESRTEKANRKGQVLRDKQIAKDKAMRAGSVSLN